MPDTRSSFKIKQVIVDIWHIRTKLHEGLQMKRDTTIGDIWGTEAKQIDLHF